MKALEALADHVGPRIEAAAFELRLHFVGVPRRDAPRNMVDHAGERRPRLPVAALTARAAGRRGRATAPGRGGRRAGFTGLASVADDDLADVTDLERRLPRALVVLDLPSHQITVERGAAAIVRHGVG